MKKIILIAILLSLVILAFTPYKTTYERIEEPTPPPVVKPPVEPKKPSIKQLIALNAAKYQVSEKTLHSVIKCESKYNPSAVGDGGHSFGLVQIHLPSHPEVTKAQALSPEFAVDFLAKGIKKGRGNMWTCFTG